MSAAKPLSVLIAALGGEGGGVLTDWLVAAARQAGLLAQSTSIPGVAQRTGATTYYVEIFPVPLAELGDRRPVLGLYPVAGAIDLMVASELVEAGRAMRNGFVSPERTTLIAATHRVYATIEKMGMADDRADAARLRRAAAALPRRAILFDPKADPEARRLQLNAVLLGAIAGSAVLPLPLAAFEQAVRNTGKAVDANLAGFRYGLRIARGEVAPVAEERPMLPPGVPGEFAAAVDAFPAAAAATVAHGIARLIDYQDADYARLYVERLKPLCRAAPALLEEAARQLALWMSYEDIIRVADLKSRPERLAQVRSEARAADLPLRVVDYLKPGIDEIAAILPARLGRRLLAWGERRDLLDRGMPLRLNAAGISGFVLLRLLARLKPMRRRSLRFATEQAAITLWLDLLVGAAESAPALAEAIARLPGLRKGYGDTHRRGRQTYELLLRQAVEPALRPGADARSAAHRLAEAYAAAVADPEGKRLRSLLAAGASQAAAAE